MFIKVYKIENIFLPCYEFNLLKSIGFPGGSTGKESSCNAGDTGDMGVIPGSGRPLGGGNGNPFQYSCLEDSMDRGAWGTTAHRVAKSRTRPRYLGTHTHRLWGLNVYLGTICSNCSHEHSSCAEFLPFNKWISS